MEQLKKEFGRTLLCITLLICTFTANAQEKSIVYPDWLAGELPVSYDVSASGAFTYSLPIDLPPGINGMIPSLAISYNSQGGNGLLGIGWSLSGVSSITRANSTIFHDDKLDPVDFDGNDDLLLDGQRLVKVSGNTYMTEIKNFAVITSYGTAGSGPQNFKVEQANGLIYYYGGTVSSRFLPPGKSDVLVWGLNRVTDRNGNYIDFNYHNNQNDGTFRLESIIYSGNAASPVPTNAIYFNYMDRFSDKNASYVAGCRVQDVQVLKNIDIYHNDNSNAVYYGFNYDLNFNTRLTEITEIRPGFKALPSIKINWNIASSDSIASIVYDGYSGTSTNNYRYLIGDYNGDGASDFGRFEFANSLGSIELFNSAKNDHFVYNTASSMQFNGDNYQEMQVRGDKWSRHSIDYNGDGYDDLILVENYKQVGLADYGIKMHYYEAVPTGGFTYEGVILYYANMGAPNSKGQYYVAETKIIPGDFDGDGKKDFFVAIPYDLTGYDEGQEFNCFIVGHAYQGAQTLLNLGNWGALYAPGDFRHLGTIPHEIYATVPMDYNGDGKTDLLITNDAGNTATPNDKDCEIYTLSTSYINGIVSNPGGINMIYTDDYPSHRTRIQPYSTNNTGIYTFNIYAGDFNGDGKDDLLSWTPLNPKSYGSGGLWKLAYSTGLESVNGQGGGWQTSVATSPVNSGELFHTGPWFPLVWGYHVADFDGDGKADIVQMQDDATGKTYNAFYCSGLEFSKKFGTLPSNFKADTRYHYLGDFNGDGQTDILWDNTFSVTPSILYFKKSNRFGLVASIDHAGKRLSIQTKAASELGAPYTYVPWLVNGHTQTEYPYISRNLPIKVVTHFEDNITSKKTYEYQTLSYHLTGLGFQGFHETRINDISDPNSPNLIKNQYSLFPKLWGTQGGYSRVPVLCTTSVFVQDDLDQWILSSTKRYSYLDEDGGAGGKVRLFMNYGTIETDFGAGTYTDIHKDFYPYTPGTITYDLGQPVYVEISKGVRNGYAVERSTFTYNSSLPFWNRIKPASILKTTTFPGKPPYSRTTNFAYTTAGQLAKKTLDPGTPNETVNDYQYDAFGNILSDLLSAPNASPALPVIQKNWTYTNDKRFVKQTKEYHNNDIYIEENVSISNWGKALEQKAKTGLITKYEYDVVNRLVKLEMPNGNIERTKYKWAYTNVNDNPPSGFNDYKIITANEGAAQLVVEETVDGITGINYEFFDFYKRKIREAYQGYDGNSIYIDKKYGKDGNLNESASPYPSNDPSAAVITYNQYDHFNRNIGYNTSAGTGLSVQYQANIGPSKLITTSTTSGGHTKISHSDAIGVYKVEDNGTPIETFYNSNGGPNEVVVNNDQSLKTTYVYDNYGRLTSKTEPNSGTISFTYNAFGEVTSQTDANGNTYEFTYDALGRVIEKRQAGQPIGYTYTYYNTANQPSTGKIMLETSPYGTSKQYYYDVLGQLEFLHESVPGNAPFITQYTYDVKGRINTRTYPSGHVTQNNYSNTGFLQSIDLIGGTTLTHRLWEATSRDHNGNLVQANYFDRLGNVVYVSDRTYHPLGYTTSRSVSNLNGAILSQSSYNYDIHTGNLQDRTDKLNHSESFSYDDHDRLKGVNGFGQPIQLTYDDVGNVLQKSNTTASSYQWKYNKYALIQVPEPANSTPGWILPPADQTVTYYPFKKVNEVVEQDFRVSFTYGPDNQRCKAIYADISTTPYPTRIQERYYAAGYEKTKTIGAAVAEELCYVSAGGELIAVLKKETTPSGVTDAVYYIATDNLGSITEVMDDEGISNSGLLEERSYDAWGRPRDLVSFIPHQPNQPQTWLFDRGFTGHEHLWIKGLFDFGIINMNGRLYDPATGRMFSPDPLLASGSISECYNKYSYANNNPLKFTDPSGNFIPQIVVAAFISGLSNLAANAGSIKSFGDGLLRFGVGAGTALAGFGAGAAIGAVAQGGTFLSGAAIGAAGGVAGGFVGGAGNGWLSGQSFNTGMNSGLLGAAIGGVGGGVIGGLVTGIKNVDMERNFWTGRGKAVEEPEMCTRGTGAPFGDKVEDQDPVAFTKQHQPLKKLYQKAQYPKFVNGGKKAFEGTREILEKNLDKDITWGITSPPNDDWSKVGPATIYINPVAYDGDKTLYLTIQHELTHAIDVATGKLAIYYVMSGFRKTNALNMTEHNAWLTNQSTTEQWWGKGDEEYLKATRAVDKFKFKGN